jgi:predicted metalloprotease with PDZ domain
MPIPRLMGLAALLLVIIHTQAQVHYTLTYTDSVGGKMHVKIDLDSAIPTPVTFIMPRSVPGNYGVTKYDLFVGHLQANGQDGTSRPFIKSSYGAPRWRCGDTSYWVKSVSYDIDLHKMEDQLHAASDKSILRHGFAGVLNYSVLGWIEGYDRRPVRCTINTYDGWPVFSTLAPAADPPKGRLAINTPDYYTLADGQTFIGPAFRVKAYKALVPLYVASYTEGPDEILDGYGWQETKCLGILKDYFGSLPFPCYTVLIRKAVPAPNDDPGNFGMEHLQSSTFFGDTSDLRTNQMEDKELWESMPTYLHHMAHSFIPLRCYGDNYRPYVQEIPPVINNIWFNEGFMWYIVYDTMKQKRWIDRFRQSVFSGSEQIKEMSLTQLSQIASFQYAEDFRLGVAVFSRGALMADDINTYIKLQTGGKASMRTIFRYLYEWSVRNGRPFNLDEFPGLIREATGVGVTAIYNKWQQPIGNIVAPR